MFKDFGLENIDLTKYLFFTGKGGVGKTSTACAVAVALADSGKKIILVSTDPASNLQDVFDTAPTGNTIRMLQLPSAWTDFISESSHGASCLGQLSGLEDKKEIYKNAVDNLADGEKVHLTTTDPASHLKFVLDRWSWCSH